MKEAKELLKEAIEEFGEEGPKYDRRKLELKELEKEYEDNKDELKRLEKKIEDIINKEKVAESMESKEKNDVDKDKTDAKSDQADAMIIA